MSYMPDDLPATKADVGDLRREVGDLRTELHTEIGQLRSELHTEIGQLRRELHTGIGELRTEIRGDLRRLDDRFGDLYQSMHAQTRVHVAASLGSAVTVAGFVFIAAQLA